MSNKCEEGGEKEEKKRERKKQHSGIYTFTIAETDVAKPKKIDARIQRHSRISSRFSVLNHSAHRLKI